MTAPSPRARRLAGRTAPRPARRPRQGRLRGLFRAGLAGLLAACAAAPAPAPSANWPLRADTVLANGGDRDADLLHVSLDVTIDYEGRRVYGTTTSSFRALLDGTRSLRLHGEGLEVREVTDSKGRRLPFVLVPPEIRIELAEPLARGEEEQLTVTYLARPERGLYFRDRTRYSAGFAPEVWTQGQPSDHRYWAPLWDLPNDRATVDLRARVGLDMTLVANGELVGVEDHGGGERSFRWRMEDEIPTYLIALAAGRWETYEDRAGDVPLAYHVGPGTGEARARGALGETPAMLAWFEERLGVAYPYAKYDQVVVHEFTLAGMENASVTFLTDEILGSADELADLDGDPRLLVAHELAHQWFGDLVTCLGWSHLWLNEAWASFLELRYEEHATDRDNYRLWLQRYLERYLARGGETRLPLAVDWHSQGACTDRAHHVYDKGPWVLHMLEHELGAPAFWQATRAYLERHAGGLVTTHDFGRAVFDETGRNVEGFLEQWVTLGGHPELRVVVGADAVEVRQVQVCDELVPRFDVPLEVGLAYADGRWETARMRVDGEVQRLSLPPDADLADVVVDPDGALFATFDVRKPPAMWIASGGDAAHPVAQWRALPELRAAAGESRPALLALLRVLLESPQPLLRQRAARLADLPDPRAHQTLLKALASDPSPRVRHEAAHALVQASARGEFTPAGASYDVLVAALQAETSPLARQELELLLRLEPSGARE